MKDKFAKLPIRVIDTTKLFKFTPEEEAYLSLLEKFLPYHRRIDYFIRRMEEEVRRNLFLSYLLLPRIEKK